ncbi:MAG: 5'/3'-nucleotidase SurE [Dictyoglomaceae bacterium]
MIIFITNDDGINSPSLEVIINKFKSFGEIYGVLPERERSGGSHALTFHKPLRVYPYISKEGVKIWSSNGTPADCVLLGLYSLLPYPPSIVISGINKGYNLGNNVIYSGTVSGAREAAINGIPAISISVSPEGREKDFEIACEFLLKIIPLVIKFIPYGVFLNINIPPLESLENVEVEFTYQGKFHYKNRVEKRLDPWLREYYWIYGELRENNGKGSDIEAIKNGKISITPLRWDMTDYSILNNLKENFKIK